MKKSFLQSRDEDKRRAELQQIRDQTDRGKEKQTDDVQQKSIFIRNLQQ